MVNFQLPLPGLARSPDNLTPEERDFIEYFSVIDHSCISPVVDQYAGIGPRGYGVSLILARIIKVKERILSDRQLAKALRRHDLYRFVTGDVQPSHNTFHTLRQRLGIKGHIEIHKRFVIKSNDLGLLDPEIRNLPKNRRKGIILVADSTFLITAGSTKGEKDDQGNWHFPDDSVAFSGKGHHRHKYPVGHKAHSLRSIGGIPLVTITTPASESDQNVIMTLIEELMVRYPSLDFAYVILDRGYDTEEIHHDIYEFFGIIPIIIRKKMVYPKGFTKEGYPLCPWSFPMKPKGIDYERKRTRFACFRICKNPRSPFCSMVILTKSNTLSVTPATRISKTVTVNTDQRYPTVSFIKSSSPSEPASKEHTPLSKKIDTEWKSAIFTRASKMFPSMPSNMI